MSTKERVYHLSDILELKPCMKIAIDESVEKDENGCFIINVGYMRVSTDKQVEKFGLEIQENDILRYATLSEYSNLVLFIDDGWTGTNMERPALKEIITLIESYNRGRSKIKINTFIVARIDRLGRTLLGTLEFIQDYIVAQQDSKNSRKNHNKEDINFVSVAENYCRIDKENPQSKFLLMLFATLAEFDRDQIVQKLKNGRTRRVASGKWIGGGNVPYGYRYNKEEGLLEIEPDEAANVREIYRLFVEEKMSPGKLATLFGFASDASISQILKRKMLTGCLIWQGVEYPGQHEPIIPLETWNMAQEELARRSVHRTNSYYLLSSLIECGECGAKMRYQKWGKGVKIICYSTQKSTAKNKPSLVKDSNCPSENYWREDVEDAVINELFKLSYLGATDDQKSEAYIDPIKVLNERLTAAQEESRRLYLLYSKGDDSKILQELIDEQKKLLQNIASQIEEEQQKAVTTQKVEHAKSLLRNLESAWPQMTDAERQSVCQELIERVVIYRSGKIDVHLKLRSFLIKNGDD